MNMGITGADPGLFRGEWLGALAIHSFDIPLNIDNICEAFVKDYIHVHARMKNYIMYMAMYVQANSTKKKRYIQKRIKTK